VVDSVLWSFFLNILEHISKWISAVLTKVTKLLNATFLRISVYLIQEPAINTLKELETFLTENPTEIVTIFIEDYVHTQMSLSKLFTNADLVKYWYPVSNMPTNGKDWPTVTEMVSKNHRLLVFTSDSSKEASEGIAYQWRYFLENECKILSFYLSIFFSVCERVSWRVFYQSKVVVSGTVPTIVMVMLVLKYSVQLL
jgi:hypothetical protein